MIMEFLSKMKLILVLLVTISGISILIWNDYQLGIRNMNINMFMDGVIKSQYFKRRTKQLNQSNVEDDCGLDVSDLKADYLNLPDCISCSEDLDLVILVKSSVDHFQQRSAIRRTWGYFRAYSKNVRIFFLLGRSEKNETINKVATEVHMFGDIIQGSFVEAYKNLTKKTILGFHWISKFCRNARFVMSADDDAYVHVDQILDLYANAGNGTMECGNRLVKNAKVKRKGKWAVPEEKYNSTRYPPYCLGICYIMSVDVALKLYASWQTFQLDITVDDAYITGILREHAHIELRKAQTTICSYLDNKNSDLRKIIVNKWIEENVA